MFRVANELVLSISEIPSSGREEGVRRLGVGASSIDWLETDVAEWRVFIIGRASLERLDEECEGLTPGR